MILTTIAMTFFSATSFQKRGENKDLIHFARSLLAPLFPPQSITVKHPRAMGAIYYDEDYKLEIVTNPQNANRDFTFTTNDPDCTIDDDGSVHLKSLERKNITCTVTSKHDPHVSNTFYLYGYGIRPDDPRIERLDTGLYKDSAGKLPVSNVLPTYPYFLNTYAIVKAEYLRDFGLTPETNRIPLLTRMELASKDGSVLHEPGSQKVTFTKSGDVQFSMRLFHVNNLDPEPNYFDIPALEQSVTVAPRGKDYTPVQPLAPYSHSKTEKISDWEYTVYTSTKIDVFSLFITSQPGYNTSYTLEVDEDSNDVYKQAYNVLRKITNTKPGTIRIRSLLDPELVTTVHLVPDAPKPTKMLVTCPEEISIYAVAFPITVKYNDNLQFIYKKSVRVEVLEGTGVAEFNEDGTAFHLKKFGNFKIKITSVEFPELSVEKEVKVVLIDRERFFPKVIGHMGTFFLIGMGCICFLFLLARPRKLTPMYAMSGIFAYAIFTELLQSGLFGNNRGFSILDIGINCGAALLGILVALAIAGIFVLFVKLNKEKYRVLKEDADRLTFKTIFKK